jgi:homoserine dehydrogenase
MDRDVIRIGLLGLGTVGTGVVRLVESHRDDLVKQTGRQILIEKVLVQDPEKPRNVEVQGDRLTTRAEEILRDDNIHVIVEVMGGIEPTRDYVREAILHGKHVVTANKDLMALHGAELLAAAKDKGRDLLYEASVAGGIPILRAITEGFSSERMVKIMGIVNGTTNHILTEMSQKGVSFEVALAEAQARGFAEADPSSDVEGWDAARKMAILATLGFKMEFTPDDVSVRGIADVTPEDLRFAEQLGYVLKLIGLARRDDNRVEVSVEPTLLPREHALASVNGVYNAVCVHGEAVGETMFYGPGAGEMPTAAAVVSDLVTVVKNMNHGINGRAVLLPYKKKRLKSPREIRSRHFLRLRVPEQAGVLAKITHCFAEADVSLEKVLQLLVEREREADIVLITHTASLDQMNRLRESLEHLDAVQAVESWFRVECGA